MQLIADIKEALFHLAFPHVCDGCGSDLLDAKSSLCIKCTSMLPETAFHLHDDNPIEKIFWGRLPFKHATAQYYFSKESLMQRLMHSFKYRSNKALGIHLGKLMGVALNESERFDSIDALVPLPLYPAKEKRRGYNQAAVLCEGMAEIMKKPVLNNVILRTTHTESQTKKNRVQRWENIDGKFELINSQAIEGKHILLVDDVVTTGATLEACGRELLQAPDIQLSFATLCFSSH